MRAHLLALPDYLRGAGDLQGSAGGEVPPQQATAAVLDQVPERLDQRQNGIGNDVQSGQGTSGERSLREGRRYLASGVCVEAEGRLAPLTWNWLFPRLDGRGRR